LLHVERLSSLKNALRILGLLGPERPVLRVGEVCRDLDLPKSSVSRLLKTLGESGVLGREPGELGYVAGPRSLELGELYRSRHTLLDLIDGTIDRLVGRFGFAGYAGVLSGLDLVIIRVKHGSYPLRLMQQVGKGIPAYDTAIGRALLSRLPAEEAAKTVPGELQAGAPPHRTELDGVYQSGIAQVESAVIPGIAAIGAAIRPPDGGEALGFSVSFPTGAVSADDHREIAAWVRSEAAAIAGRVGDSYWATRAEAPLRVKPLVDGRGPHQASSARPRLARSGP
jgi:DNA-binding IclR family transcriptional regulator